LQLIKDPCETRKILKTSSHILGGNGSLPNRKSTSQKEVNNKIHSSQTMIHLKLYPNIDQYFLDLQVKFQLDPTVGFGVMLKSVKLDSRKFYDKIQIWPCLDRIKDLGVKGSKRLSMKFFKIHRLRWAFRHYLKIEIRRFTSSNFYL